MKQLLLMMEAVEVGAVEAVARAVTVMEEVVPGMAPVLRVPDRVMAAAMGPVEPVPVVMVAATGVIVVARVMGVAKGVTVTPGMEEKVMEKPAMQMMAMVDMRLGITLLIPVVLLQKAGLSVR